MADDPAPLPAHRPSRRQAIVEAAIIRFGRDGFVATSLASIAEDADVSPSAVYYHFDTKAELYETAVIDVLDSLGRCVAGVDAAATNPRQLLDAVIEAVWRWIDEHPDHGRLFYVQSSATTPTLVRRRAEFTERHVRAAVRYFDSSGDDPLRSGREVLAARTLVDMLISLHAMRLGGSLGDLDETALRAELGELGGRLIDVA